jgi:general secretion pathway protein D
VTLPRILLAAALVAASPAAAQRAQVSSGPDGITVNIVDAELRAAVQSLARYMDRPVLFGQVGGNRVTLQAPQPVPPSQIPDLLRSILDANGHELVADGGVYRVQQKQAAPPAQGPGFVQPQAQPAANGGIQLFVIRLRHARAADVAATVNALYGRASALGELGDRSGSLNDQLRGNRIPPAGTSQPGVALTDRPAVLGGELVMVPDERTNALLVRATAADFQLIQEAVRQLDIRPLQVLIEVVIAEVRRNSSFSLGLSAALDSVRLRGHGATISGGNTGLADLRGFVLRVMGIGGDVNVNLALEAAASRGDATIVSRPVVLAANNEAAEVLVGDQVPFVQLQRTLPTDNGVRDQVVQYKDVGTQLNVRPTISADGYVMLEVLQELNDVNTATTISGLQAPVISTRSVRTRLLVNDGQTAVLGGLARRKRDQSRGGVPGLSRIPLVGWLFGGTSRNADDTELFIFLTPRVIRNDAEMDSATTDVRGNAPDVTRATRKLPSYIAPPARKNPHPPPAPPSQPQPQPGAAPVLPDER